MKLGEEFQELDSDVIDGLCAKVADSAHPAKAPKIATRKTAARKTAARKSSARKGDPKSDVRKVAAPKSAALKIASAPKSATSKVAASKSAALKIAPAPESTKPAAPVVPVRKRPLKITPEQVSAAVVNVVAEIVHEAEVADEVLAVSRGTTYDLPGLLRRTLRKPGALVSHSVADEFVRLLIPEAGRRFHIESCTRFIQLTGQEAAVRKASFAKIVFGKDVKSVLWPMVARSHYALLCVNLEDETATVLDSIESLKSSWNTDVHKIVDLFRSKLGWKSERTVLFREVQQQNNGFDCGVYCLLNLRCIVNGIDFLDPRLPGGHVNATIRKTKVNFHRGQMADEITSRKLVKDWLK